MKKVGIITIHRVHNYGSVLQAYALQRCCEDMGYAVEIIDYIFPNKAHLNNRFAADIDRAPTEPRWIKALYALALMRQHKGISSFIGRNLHLSPQQYASPDELRENPPCYDVYITGSDQLWNPRYCNGDTAFMLDFAPVEALKISYAASIGASSIPVSLRRTYRTFLSRYCHISVRERTGVKIVREIADREAKIVLDPTLLLPAEEWNRLATPKRLISKKYILCYYLNYTFQAFPYADLLAKSVQKQTGYEIVWVARPPRRPFMCNARGFIGASPEDFLALVRDAEIVLTTSFHGTAFAVNYAKPLFSIVQDKLDTDARITSLLSNLGMDLNVVSMNEPFPDVSRAFYDVRAEQKRLFFLRNESMSFLNKSMMNE